MRRHGGLFRLADGPGHGARRRHAVRKWRRGARPQRPERQDHLRGLRLRSLRRHGPGLRQRRALPRPHQLARPHAVQRRQRPQGPRRRALRAPPRLARRHPRPQEDWHRRLGRRRARQAVRRNAHAAQRRDQPGRQRQRREPRAQPRRRQERRRAGRGLCRLQHVPAGRQQRDVERHGLQVRQDRDRLGAQGTHLLAARVRGHRRRSAQRIRLPHRQRRWLGEHHRVQYVDHSRHRPHRGRHRRRGCQGRQARVEPAHQHRSLRPNGRRALVPPRRREHRARHRLDPERLDEHAARAEVRRLTEPEPVREVVLRLRALEDGHGQRRRRHGRAGSPRHHQEGLHRGPRPVRRQPAQGLPRHHRRRGLGRWPGAPRRQAALRRHGDHRSPRFWRGHRQVRSARNLRARQEALCRARHRQHARCDEGVCQANLPAVLLRSAGQRAVVRAGPSGRVHRRRQRVRPGRRRHRRRGGQLLHALQPEAPARQRRAAQLRQGRPGRHLRRVSAERRHHLQRGRRERQRRRRQGQRRRQLPAALQRRSGRRRW